MITQKEIEKMLNETGIEYRYHHFETEEAVAPPFICYVLPRTRAFSADGKPYYKINRLDIELYTDSKDMRLERKVEDILEKHGMFYEKTETYIESEDMYEVLYEMEV